MQELEQLRCVLAEPVHLALELILPLESCLKLVTLEVCLDGDIAALLRRMLSLELGDLLLSGIELLLQLAVQREKPDMFVLLGCGDLNSQLGHLLRLDAYAREIISILQLLSRQCRLNQLLLRRGDGRGDLPEKAGDLRSHCFELLVDLAALPLDEHLKHRVEAVDGLLPLLLDLGVELACLISLLLLKVGKCGVGTDLCLFCTLLCGLALRFHILVQLCLRNV